MPEKGIKNRATGCLVLIVPVAFLIVFVSTTWRYLLALAVVAIAWYFWDRYQWLKLSRQIDPIFQQAILANQGSITPLDLSLKSNLSAMDAEKYLNEKAELFGAQKRDFADRGAVYYFLTVKTLGTLFDESEPTPETELSTAPEAPTITEEVSSPIPPSQPEEIIPEAPTITEEISSPIPLNQLEEITPEASEETSTSESATELNMVALPPIPGSFSREAPESPELASKQIPDPWQPESAIAHLKPLIQAELAKRLDVSASTVFKRREDPDFREWTMARDPDGIAWEYSPETKEFYPVEQA